MKRFALALAGIILLAGSAAGQGDRLIGGRFPALSPDGSQIAFSYMGDIWVVASEGGTANRITNHVAYEREPVWSPDGSMIAFTSNRTGNDDVFVVPAAGGEPRRLTFHSGSDLATDFSPDGRWIYFTSGRTSSLGIYRISVAGGNARPVMAFFQDRLYDARISPDGRTLLFARGMENGSRWRSGYRGANSSKLWSRSLDGGDARLIVTHESNAFWPAWSPDGRRVYFTSDRENATFNLWSAAADGSDARPVTRFRQGDVRWLRVAREAPRAVCERDFGIWLIELETGRARAVPIDTPNEPKENRTLIVENDPVSEYAVSPDSKKIAAVVRGEIFVLSVEGGYARNLTNTPWRERDVFWDRESRRVFYVSDPEAVPDLFAVNALGDAEPVRLTRTPEDVLNPVLSPDGEWIAYHNGPRQLRLVRPDGGDDRLLAEDFFGGRFGAGFAWSPDSRYVAYVARISTDQDIYAVEVATGEKTRLTNTAYDETSPVWSPDGRSLFFSSNRYGHSFPEFTGKWDIYRLHLTPPPPTFDEDEFEALFREPDSERAMDEPVERRGGGSGTAAGTDEVTVTLELENIDRQTEQVANTLGSEREPLISPKDSDTVYFLSNLTGRSQLWKVTREDDRWGRYEEFAPSVSSPGNLQFDPTGRWLFYTSGGRLGRIDMNTGRGSGISFSTRIEVDKTDDYRQMLAELAYVLEYYYYDPGHHTADWRRVYEEYLPVLEQVREDTDFYEYANEMIGRLNSSHTGIRPPSGGFRGESSAHLGARLAVGERRITIEHIFRDGPLWAHRDRVAPGDELLAIDGEEVSVDRNIWPLLNGKLGRRVTLTIRSATADSEVVIPIEPISGGAESGLMQEEWIESCRERVREATGDRSAYIYMSAMGSGDLNRFLLELERDGVPREGLILDLRWNMGGNVHDRVLEALCRPVYARWRVRGMPEAPQSTFGFADRPVVLITNEITLSDGEMTANGFKALKRGTIVGNTTYGWLIFTTSHRLLNGGSFRLPFEGCYTLEGEDLETIGGVAPDILVINDLNHELNGIDPQLDEAIRVLKEMIGR